MARSDLERCAERAAMKRGGPRPNGQELDELSHSWAELYDAEQAGTAGLNAVQHRQAAEERALRRRDAAGG